VIAIIMGLDLGVLLYIEKSSELFFIKTMFYF
jgi:hypothetical protein